MEPGLLYRVLMLVGIFPIGRLLFRIRVHGRQHLPERGGMLIAANHQSYLDIPLISYGAWRRHVAYVARASLAGSRILAWTMKHCGAILIRRGERDLAAIRAMTEALQAGDLVALFPEGTRTRDGQLGPFKKGAALAARRAGVRILPCAIRGTFEAWPPQRRLPRVRRLEIEFGEPIDSGRSDAIEAVRVSIAGMLAPTAPPHDRGSDEPRPDHRGSDEPRDDEPVPSGP